MRVRKCLKCGRKCDEYDHYCCAEPTVIVDEYKADNNFIAESDMYDSFD